MKVNVFISDLKVKGTAVLKMKHACFKKPLNCLCKLEKYANVFIIKIKNKLVEKLLRNATQFQV